MCLHSWSHQGPHDPSNGTIFTLNPHWGRVATGETKSLASMHVGVTSVVSNSLQPCGLWSTRLLCHWGFPGKNTGVYSPILVAIPFQNTILTAAIAANPPEYWCCQNPCDPSSCTTSAPGPHRGKHKLFRVASGANPSRRPKCRGGNKTTVETQGQCG